MLFILASLRASAIEPFSSTRTSSKSSNCLSIYSRTSWRSSYGMGSSFMTISGAVALKAFAGITFQPAFRYSGKSSARVGVIFPYNFILYKIRSLRNFLLGINFLGVVLSRKNSSHMRPEDRLPFSCKSVDTQRCGPPVTYFFADIPTAFAASWLP